MLPALSRAVLLVALTLPSNRQRKKDPCEPMFISVRWRKSGVCGCVHERVPPVARGCRLAMRARGSPPFSDKWEKPQWPRPKWQAKWKQFFPRQRRAAVTRACYATLDRTLCVGEWGWRGEERKREFFRQCCRDLTQKTVGISLWRPPCSGVCHYRKPISRRWPCIFTCEESEATSVFFLFCFFTVTCFTMCSTGFICVHYWR